MASGTAPSRSSGISRSQPGARSSPGSLAASTEAAVLRTHPPPQQGMGGQHGYFGLWVDVDFGKGHSKAKPKCTTYNSPQLSAQENFSFEKMEVWAVGDAAGSQQVSGGHCSALSKLPLSLLRLEVVYPKLGPSSCWTQRCSWTRSRAGSPVPSRRGPWGFIE